MNANTFKKISSLVSGIDNIGVTWGASWADFNGDGYVDLWVNNHWPVGSLYINQGDGTFKDSTTEIFTAPPLGDDHGAAWADFDNDGDPDLINLVGSKGGRGIGSKYDNLMYVNENGKLDERADSLGLAYSLARGRSPLWFDFNNDGRLDMFVAADPRRDDLYAPATIFLQQTNGTFKRSSKITGFELPEAPFGILSDLSGDGKLDFIVAAGDSVKVYDTTSLPLKDITATTISNDIKIYGDGDIISSDFNGDLRPDLYITADSSFENALYRADTDSLVTQLVITKPQETKGIYFDTIGEISIDMRSDKASVPVNRIYVGANGIHPNSKKFTLSPDDPNVRGVFSQRPNGGEGVYISYDPLLQRWEFILASGNTLNATKKTLLALIDSTESIVESIGVGFDDNAPPKPSQLLINTPEGFIDTSDESGINSILASAKKAVAGDFDNDMDEDIYVVTSVSYAENTPDILYENQGNGTFVAVPKAGGAIGNNLGMGDFVTSTDYDLDGFLDFLVGNGDSDTAVTALVENAPSYDLFKNQGNGNHWLEIDLRGVVSNRDGIGAQVFLTAGGVTQMRQQAGGMHNGVQDSQRIHFGLANNTSIDKLVVQWSSGETQIITDIPVDRLIEVVEKLGNENNNFSGGQKNNVLTGGDSDDILSGNGGKDILIGKSGNDFLSGGSDDDILIGGNGIDTMKGESGSDIFRFSSFQGGLNIIQDFVVADDTIQVSAANFGGGLTLDRAITPEQLRIGAIAINTEQRFIYNPVSGALSFDRDGSGSAFDPVSLATLSSGLAITNEDIFAID
jgi:Ca2+-binding RTX toxin-like protein